MIIRLAALVLSGLFPLLIWADTLNQIVIEGNKKTRSEVIEQEMLLKIGDEITKVAIEQSRQAIMDLGLFRRVEILQEQEADIVRLVVTVKEKKHDWYILPRIDRNADGDVTLGMNLRANNFNGLNQSAKLTAAYKKFDDATTDELYGISWRFSYPRIIGTPYSAYNYATAAQSVLDEEREGFEGSYDRTEYVFGIGIGRWFSPTGVSKGLHASLGIEFQRFEHDHLSGAPGLYDDVTEISLAGSLSYNTVHDLLYSRKGYALGMALKQANETLGSDRPYFNKYAFYRHYLPLPWREHTNFNVQIQGASGNRSIFGDPIYELSGSTTLRGYRRETLEGDAYFLVNTQFLTPIFGKKNLRAGVLFDFGNAYESFSEIKDLEFESGAGVSLRWKLKQWVDTEIRIDYAQGLGEEGSSRVYVSGDAMF
ncbi:MAG: BamA/TamA family outer membrane protein [Proteobacteria bacterium]|nr:BamA/TamA family outer membrane protein [Pseudomonadota bacterium]